MRRYSTQQKWVVTACLVAALGLLILTVVVGAQDGSPSFRDPRVFPPASLPFGKSYGEWGAAWWQWVNAIPAPDNPLLDETGEKCMVGQHGPVWFLTGVNNISGTVTRHCAVPEGTALFFPILNIESAIGLDPFPSVRELRDSNTAIMDLATDLLTELDGIPIRSVDLLRFTSPLFSLTLPPDSLIQAQGNPAGVPGTYFPAADEGFYVMLKPLSVGPHTLRIHGEVPSFGFVLDVTYHLTVIPLRLQ